MKRLKQLSKEVHIWDSEHAAQGKQNIIDQMTNEFRNYLASNLETEESNGKNGINAHQVKVGFSKEAVALLDILSKDGDPESNQTFDGNLEKGNYTENPESLDKPGKGGTAFKLPISADDFYKIPVMDPTKNKGEQVTIETDLDESETKSKPDTSKPEIKDASANNEEIKEKLKNLQPEQVDKAVHKAFKDHATTETNVESGEPVKKTNTAKTEAKPKRSNKK